MIGSPSAIEGKDKESWESGTVRDGPPGLSRIDVNRCLLAGLGVSRPDQQSNRRD